MNKPSVRTRFAGTAQREADRATASISGYPPSQKYDEHPEILKVLTSIPLVPQSTAAATAAFRELLSCGTKLVAGGRIVERPSGLARGSFAPQFEIAADPFGLRIFLSAVHQNPDLRFMVAYVLKLEEAKPRIYARIFYKDTSLIWRCASHIVKTRDELWIGKGDVTTLDIDGEPHIGSLESTCDLPYELQMALETAARSAPSTPASDRILERVLRRAPAGRIEPYADFTEPRRRAAADPRNLINRGRPVAVIKRANEPESLEFAKRFEPDLADGFIEMVRMESGYYGGAVEFWRFLSVNRKIQYGFMAAPEQVWLIPPQTLSLDVSTFAVRTVDVPIDEDVCVPGYEFHFHHETENGVELHSQIPEGFAGPHHPDDEDRADASAWIERLPVIRAFRRCRNALVKNR